MGFDWDLHVNLYVDHKTGLPYVFHQKQLKNTPFSLEEWRIPEHLRSFAQMRGWHLIHYVKHIDQDGAGPSRAGPEALLYEFPSWEDIKENECWKYADWDEAKHNLFKEFLQWCAEKGGFSVSWSY
jgi:hypothetical protein